jgi:hypothetical protein
LNLVGSLRIATPDVEEETMGSGRANVTSRNAVVPLLLEVVKKGEHAVYRYMLEIQSSGM